MKKQDIFYTAKEEYQMYKETGRKIFKESASRYYNQYKELKGKKIIEGLEK